jgi:CxxC motif-containing protein (DUF1111 family)
VYNNTFIDAPASFERTQRTATEGRFGWQPSTGPDVNQREGHVFANNLMVATTRKPVSLRACRSKTFSVDMLWPRPPCSATNGSRESEKPLSPTGSSTA